MRRRYAVGLGLVLVLTAVSCAHSAGASGNSPPAESAWEKYRSEAISAVIGALVAGVIGLYFARRHHKATQPRKRIVCRATYCTGLLSEGAAHLGDGLKIEYGGAALRQPTIVTFDIQCIGNTPAQSVLMRLETAKGDSIVRSCFYVDDEVKCDRLKTLQPEADVQRFSWSYLNPGETIELVVLVSPCSDPRCVRLGIDAEGLEVEQRGMRMDCSPALAPGCDACR